MPTVKTFEQEVPNDGDYQTHNLEIKVPDLPAGYYTIISSLTPDFKYSSNLTSYAQVISSDITLVSAADKLILQGVGAFETYRKKHLKV